MFCFAADTERLPDCDDAALNFPINIRRASVFQTGPLSEDELSPLFSTQPKWTQTASIRQFNWKTSKAIMSFDRVWSRVTQWSVSSRQKGGQASAQPQFQQQPMQKCVVAKQKKTKNTTHYPFLEVSVIYYIKKQQWHCSSGSLCCYKIIKSWSISDRSVDLSTNTATTRNSHWHSQQTRPH